MSKRSPGYATIDKLLTEFPNAPTRTLAAKALRDNPGLWKDFEQCRSYIRKQRGLNGKWNRKYGDPKHFREPGEWKQHLPQPLNHFENWGPLQVSGPARVLQLSDLHIPYHDLDAINLAIDYGLSHRANLVLLNGDVCDHFSLSHWQTDPRERNLKEEIKQTKQFLRVLRGAFPRARIIFKEGNHEERWESYLQIKAPELLGVEDFDWENVYDLEALRTELVGEKRPVRLGQLNVIHGHEHRSGQSNPVNPARGLFMRGQSHAICGHWHASSQHSQKSLEQNVISTWSTGCLCDMHPKYAVLNNWNHGFAFVTVEKNGAFHVENLRIIEGRIY